jgi:KaiC/GvpD/RAD55 family RecA-like ATPase/class 3 adenylate cyclase
MAKSSHKGRPIIPGLSEFAGIGTFPGGLYFLAGPAGSGKTLFCRKFAATAAKHGEVSIFMSTDSKAAEFNRQVDRIEPQIHKKIIFANPFEGADTKSEISRKLSLNLKAIQLSIRKRKGNLKELLPASIVIDSLSHILLLCGEKILVKFLSKLSSLSRDSNAIIICTLTTSDQDLYSIMSPFAAGILEMRMEENSQSFERKLRLFSIRGLPHSPDWVQFKIANDGDILFTQKKPSAPSIVCTLCGKSATGSQFVVSDFVFDTEECMETYRKLAGAYGSDITETGLPAEAFNVSFFFVDIVGLSDPMLSVKKQVQKITILNMLLDSCEALKKAAKSKRIILPTGDGMAIGFILNPELPLELSIQLHKNLRAYNRGKRFEDQVGVRIGLGSGPVYTVTDFNNVQNVWGPGIVLARRVMDAGDNGHILLAEKLAEELIALNDEYRRIIKPISPDFEIKHGQKIRLYSAYAKEFGNPQPPARVQRQE